MCSEQFIVSLIREQNSHPYIQLTERKGTMKKLISVILSFFITLSLTTYIGAVADTTPPTLSSIKTNKTSFKYPDEIIFTINAKDDISGIKYITVDIIQPGGSSGEIFQAYVDVSSNNTYVVRGAIKPSFKPGQWYISSVSLTDHSDNTSIYVPQDELAFPYEKSYGNKVSFEIKENQVGDVTPILESISVSSKNTTYASPVTIKAKITCKVPIQVIYVYYDAEGNSNARVDIELKKGADGWYSGKLDLSSMPNRYKNYIFDSMVVWDSYDTCTTFQYPSEPTEPPSKPINNNIDVFITDYNINADTTPPELVSISADKKSLSPPSTVTYTVKAKDAGGSGLKEASINVVWRDQNNADKWVNLNYSGEIVKAFNANGTINFTVTVPPNIGQGTLEVFTVWLKDKHNNQSVYSSVLEGHDINPFASGAQVQVASSSGKADFAANVKSSDLASRIKAAKDDAVIEIDCERDANIPKTIFEAIKGTNKTLILEREGVQWIFSGSQIVNPTKDINITMSVLKADEIMQTIDGQVINEMTGSLPSLVIEFSSNGLLPAPAYIRIKADYAFREYIGTHQLFFYYYNEIEGEMDLIKEKLEMSSDGFYEFTVAHNSTFVLSSAPVISKYVSKKTGGKSAGEGKKLIKEISENIASSSFESSDNSLESNASKAEINNDILKSSDKFPVWVVITICFGTVFVVAAGILVFKFKKQIALFVTKIFRK